MPNKSRLDKVYAQLLRHHPYGWALYKKATIREIHPGTCGYFDSDGDWHTIVDLTNPNSLADQGWTMPDDEIRGNNDTEKMVWGPKNSASVYSYEIAGRAGVTVVPEPTNALVNMSFEAGGDEAAVLTTASPVVKHQIGDDASAQQWMSDNTAEMLRRHGSVVKKHGIWIVTKTYSTTRCAIAVMTKNSSRVELRFMTDIQGVLALSSESAWARSSANSATELHEDEDGVVVFMSGMYFSKRRFISRLRYTQDKDKQKDHIFRGDTNEGDEEMELDVEHYPPLPDDDEGESS